MGLRTEIKVKEGQAWGRGKGSRYNLSREPRRPNWLFCFTSLFSSAGSMSPASILSNCHGRSLPHLALNLNFRPSWPSTFQGEQNEECYGVNWNYPLQVHSLNSGAVLGCCGTFRSQVEVCHWQPQLSSLPWHELVPSPIWSHCHAFPSKRIEMFLNCRSKHHFLPQAVSVGHLITVMQSN